MRVIITGPTGAIGIALIQRCILEGVEVYAVCRPKSKRMNRIPQDPLVYVIERGLDELLSGGGIIPDCDVFFIWAGRREEKLNDHTALAPENGYGMAKLCAGQMSRFECNKRGSAISGRGF